MAKKQSRRGNPSTAKRTTNRSRNARKADSNSNDMSEADVAIQVWSKEDYEKERVALIELAHKNTGEHDKAILQLSAGALGLTMTFIEKISRSPPVMPWLLGLGWAGFVFSIVSILISFSIGNMACTWQISRLDEACQSGMRRDDQNYWATYTEWANRTSLTCFVLGVVLILVFAWCNLPVNGKDAALPQGAVRDVGDAAEPSGRLTNQKQVIKPCR